MLPRRSLRWRILAAMLLVFAIGFGNLALYLYGTRDALRRSVMHIEAQAIAEGFTAVSDPATLPRQYAGAELSYSLYSADGELLWISDNLERARRLHRPWLERDDSWLRWSTWSGLVINTPVRLADGSTLMVAKNDRLERELIGGLLADRLRHSLVLMIAVSLCSALLMFLLLHWALRPVRHAADALREVGPAKPDQRLPVAGLPSEIRPLALAVNAALERLADAYAAERRFVADAAHELRTPLTVLDLRLQDGHRSGNLQWRQLESEMQQLRRLVGQLLGLARHEGMQGDSGTAVCSRPARTIRESTAALLPLYEIAGREMMLEIEDDVRCRGDAGKLREVVDNLLHNALVHGAGTVLVELRTDRGWARLDISDEGNGVPEALREEVFQRFRKGRPHAEGTGLGLAIVRRIIANLGGQVFFPNDRRSTIRVMLPLAESAPGAGPMDEAEVEFSGP